MDKKKKPVRVSKAAKKRLNKAMESFEALQEEIRPFIKRNKDTRDISEGQWVESYSNYM